MAAVKMFRLIITTNYDSLFETAARSIEQQLTVMSDTNDELLSSGNKLIKLHGSASDPQTLVLTENDIATLDVTRQTMWDYVVSAMRLKRVVVVGNSLRDPSIIRLLSHVGKELSGYFVAPEITVSKQVRLKQQWNLEAIQADSDSFFKALDSSVAGM